jgi:hypothetical protein
MEQMVDVGHEYRPGRPVRLLVTARERRLTVSDQGAAISDAGAPPGWRELADQLERELNVNITRHGAVWLPVVPAGPGLEVIVARIGDASLRFYDGLLDLAST